MGFTTAPSVTVIIPILNAEKYLPACLNSLAAQTCNDFEVIIVDGGSFDSGGLIIQGYQKSSPFSITYIVDELLKSPSEKRLRGIQESKGRYIAFLDADDIWLPSKIRSQKNFMYENSAAFSYTEFGIISDTDSIPTWPKVHSEYNALSYLTRRGICTSTVMLDKTQLPLSVFERYSVDYAEDLLWWLLIMERGIPAVLLPERLVLYRRHSNQRSRKIIQTQLSVLKIYTSMLNISAVRGVIAYCVFVIKQIVKFRRVYK
jgi:teichuronic acid biosynthesis glycosyltransferase TuaG